MAELRADQMDVSKVAEKVDAKRAAAIQAGKTNEWSEDREKKLAQEKREIERLHKQAADEKKAVEEKESADKKVEEPHPPTAMGSKETDEESVVFEEEKAMRASEVRANERSDTERKVDEQQKEAEKDAAEKRSAKKEEKKKNRKDAAERTAAEKCVADKIRRRRKLLR